MPKITYLKEIDGALWARLELDMATADGPVHVLTEKEILELKEKERKNVWEEIKRATRSFKDDWGDE
jgi:hypothetical protein